MLVKIGLRDGFGFLYGGADLFTEPAPQAEIEQENRKGRNHDRRRYRHEPEEQGQAAVKPCPRLPFLARKKQDHEPARDHQPETEQQNQIEIEQQHHLTRFQGQGQVVGHCQEGCRPGGDAGRQKKERQNAFEPDTVRPGGKAAQGTAQLELHGSGPDRS